MTTYLENVHLFFNVFKKLLKKIYLSFKLIKTFKMLPFCRVVNLDCCCCSGEDGGEGEWGGDDKGDEGGNGTASSCWSCDIARG